MTRSTTADVPERNVSWMKMVFAAGHPVLEQDGGAGMADGRCNAYVSDTPANRPVPSSRAYALDSWSVFSHTPLPHPPMRIPRLLAACALLSALPACEEVFSPRPPSPAASAFIFQHDVVGPVPPGTYNATGDIPQERASAVPPGDWAFAYRTGLSPQPVLVNASRSADGGGYDQAVILLPNGARAGQAMSMGQGCSTSPLCAQMSIEFGFLRLSTEPDVRCAIRTGTLQLQTLTERRVVGTFSGTAVCEGAHDGTTEIRGGQFDVAMIVVP